MCHATSIPIFMEAKASIALEYMLPNFNFIHLHLMAGRMMLQPDDTIVVN